MSYKIAVATSDGVYVDQSFGAASSFQIYEVTGDGYKLVETREVKADRADSSAAQIAADETAASGSAGGKTAAASSTLAAEAAADSSSGCGTGAGCGSGSGCGSGGGCGAGGGCGGAASPKVELLSDVRCLLCSKIGFQAQKQFEKKAITTFDITCEVAVALNRITGYFARVDRHQSLRGWVQG